MSNNWNTSNQAKDVVTNAGHKAGKAGKNAAATVVKDLLSWLKETLFRGARYIPVKAGKWLKVKSGEVEWADKSIVPVKQRRRFEKMDEKMDEVVDNRPRNSKAFPGDQLTSKARKSMLSTQGDLEAAKLMERNNRMLATAKNNPGVVDCDTQMGVELKKAAYEGNLDSAVSKFDIEAGEVGEIIGTELAARAGYNTFGDSLPGEINDTQASGEGSGSGESDSSGDSGSGGNPQSGRPSPGEQGSHIPTAGDSGSESESRPSPGSKGSHIPLAGGSGDSSGSSGSGGSGSGSSSSGGSGSSGGGGPAHVPIDTGGSGSSSGSSPGASTSSSGGPGVSGGSGGSSSGGSSGGSSGSGSSPGASGGSSGAGASGGDSN